MRPQRLCLLSENCGLLYTKCSKHKSFLFFRIKHLARACVTLMLAVFSIGLIIYQQLERGRYDSIKFDRASSQLKLKRDVLLVVTAPLVPWIQFQVPVNKSRWSPQNLQLVTGSRNYIRQCDANKQLTRAVCTAGKHTS